MVPPADQAMVWSISQSVAGTVQPGRMQVRSRALTRSRSALGGLVAATAVVEDGASDRVGDQSLEGSVGGHGLGGGVGDGAVAVQVGGLGRGLVDQVRDCRSSATALADALAVAVALAVAAADAVVALGVVWQGYGGQESEGDGDAHLWGG